MFHRTEKSAGMQYKVVSNEDMKGFKLCVNLFDGPVWPSHPICMSLSANESAHSLH